MLVQNLLYGCDHSKTIKAGNYVVQKLEFQKEIIWSEVSKT